MVRGAGSKGAIKWTSLRDPCLKPTLVKVCQRAIEARRSRGVISGGIIRISLLSAGTCPTQFSRVLPADMAEVAGVMVHFGSRSLQSLITRLDWYKGDRLTRVYSPTHIATPLGQSPPDPSSPLPHLYAQPSCLPLVTQPWPPKQPRKSRPSGKGRQPMEERRRTSLEGSSSSLKPANGSKCTIR